MHDVSITSRSTSSIYKDMQTYQFTLFIGTGDTNKSDVTFIIRTTIQVKNGRVSAHAIHFVSILKSYLTLDTVSG